MRRNIATAVLAASWIIAMGTASAATLTGSTVAGQLDAGLRATVTSPFAPTAVVGSGAEFTGALFQSDFGGQNFTFALDLSNTNIVIDIGSPDSGQSTSAAPCRSRSSG